ncbi:MAG: hypothetical protein Q9170_004636, partial [Blastenia crenularia]
MDMNEEGPPQTPTSQSLRASLNDHIVHMSRDSSPNLAADSPWSTNKESASYTSIAASTSPFALPSLDPSTDLQKNNMQRPWGDRMVSVKKFGMKDIMAQASSNKVSNISASLSAQAAAQSAGGSTSKLSQRERRKQHHQAIEQKSMDQSVPPVVEAEAETKSQVSPWQVASRGAKTSLKDILGAGSKSATNPRSIPDRSVSNPPLTLRQTIPGDGPSLKRAAIESTSKAQQTPSQRNTSTPQAYPAANTPPRPSSSRTVPTSPAGSLSTPTRSIHYTSPHLAAEPSLQLSMAEILSQQQTEKDFIREAAAKRSLQEIQEEQAFQEWWDQESKKAIEEEAAASQKQEGRSR